MFLYLAVSESAVSRALIQEEGIQKLVYYVSHFTNGPQTRYQRLKKLMLDLFIISRNLKYYFQTFPIIGASPKKRYREPKSDEANIEMDIRTMTLWTQIQTEDSI